MKDGLVGLHHHSSLASKERFVVYNRTDALHNTFIIIHTHTHTINVFLFLPEFLRAFIPTDTVLVMLLMSFHQSNVSDKNTNECIIDKFENVN